VSYMSTRAAMQVRGTVTVGASGGAAVSTASRSTLLLHGGMFVLGQMLVFVVFGIAVNVGIRAISGTSYDLQRTLARAGGILVIFFGLYVMGVIGWVLKVLINNFAWEDVGAAGKAIKSGLERLQGLLYADTRRQIDPRNPYGYAGSLLMGVFFAAGWTPCITPTYGLILTMVADKNAAQALAPLIAYSLGLGLPFLVAAAALNQIRGLFKRIQRHMRAIEVVSGAFLIVMGALLFSERLADLTQYTIGLNTFAGNLETCTVELFNGQLPSGDYNTCMDLGPNYKYVTPTPQPQTNGTDDRAWLPRE
ncbi:MAG TPA: cytochrome c biogenesis CcdA family protein, partial [Aggregatilineales bacterium]|nr:cytochrome c biogenesis CcdA family protein [Aggregatilineales bacterium]